MSDRPAIIPDIRDVVATLVRTLQPMVAELQEAGVGVGEWIEAVKISSYRAAHAATDAESGRAIFTRMSVRTGMTRTELQRLRHIGATGSARYAPRMMGRQRTLRVMEAWHTDPVYLDTAGRPRALPLTGAAPSLRALIKSHAGDVPVASVLSELQRQQLVIAEVGDCWRPRADYCRHGFARVNTSGLPLRLGT
jgi:hypothetical protein